jgi:hypothetical protein
MTDDYLPELDIQAAYDLGGDVAEAENHGTEPPVPRVPSAAALWRAVMDDAPRASYPADAVTLLREQFDRGRRDYW